MSKELDALFNSLLQEIDDQEKKLPKPPPASEDAQRQAERIAQDVEDDGSWQIPPEEPKPTRPKPIHAPVIVPPPVSHFTDEPSQNPAVRMRDRLEEDALPKPDSTRKPTQIHAASGSAHKKKKHRRPDPGIRDVRKQIQVKSTAGATGPAAPMLSEMTEKKKATPRIRIPDELPPDIPRVIPGQNDLPEDLDELVEAASRKPEEVLQHKREAQVRSRAEQIREQMRLRSEQAAEVPAEPTEEEDTPAEQPAQPEEKLPPLEPVRIVSHPVEHPSADPEPEEQAQEKPSFLGKFKGFMIDFLDLHDDDEEDEPAPRPPRKKAPATAEKKPLFGGLKDSLQRLTRKEEADAAPKPAVFNAASASDEEDDVKEYKPKSKASGSGTDWRSLLHKSGAQPIDDEDDAPAVTPEVDDNGEDALARAYDALELSETDTPLAEDKPQIPDEIIALLRVPSISSVPSQDASRKMYSAEDFLRDDPFTEPAAPEEPLAEEPVFEAPVTEPFSVEDEPETPEAEPNAEAQEAPLAEPEAPAEAPVPVPAKPKRERRFRNLMSFDDEETAEEPTPEPIPVPEPEEDPVTENVSEDITEEADVPVETEPDAETPEDAPAAPEQPETEEQDAETREGLAAIFRDALDESPAELEEMKAEPLPEPEKHNVQFLRRHWYFLAGILCFFLALVGLVTSISWIIGKAAGFFGSSTLRENLMKVLYPVAVVDLPAFESTSELSADTLLSAAMVDILMYDDLSNYPVSYDVISIPANDVLARAQLRFGTDFTTEFTTLHAAGETFFYDSASGCYNVPAAPSIFSYAPDVTDISRSGDTYTVTVRYVSEKASWQERSGNFKDENAKTMQVTLQQEDDNYRILRIANYTEEGETS